MRCLLRRAEAEACKWFAMCDNSAATSPLKSGWVAGRNPTPRSQACTAAVVKLSGSAKRRIKKQIQFPATASRSPRVRAQRAAVQVPWDAARGGGSGPQGGRQGCRPVCRQHRDVLSANPRNPSRTRRARPSGALLFGYFLLGTQEKVTRPPTGGRNHAAGGRRLGPSKSPSGRHTQSRVGFIDPMLPKQASVARRPIP